MIKTIKLTRDDTNSLSSFKFYNEILKDVSEFYHSVDFDNKPPIFAFTENSLVDPIVLPLIISLGNYLKKFHNNSPIDLDLTNNYSTNNLIKFLDSSDFFNLVGKNQNPTFPKGLNIFEFDERIPNDYRNKSIQRSDHKLRSYSLNDDNLKNRLLEFEPEESQRDFLIEYYTYLVENHFGTLLNDKEVTSERRVEFIDILSELITNGLIHSKSEVFIMMFSNRFKTSFSISDNGIGLFNSISVKKSNEFYENMTVFNQLKKEVKFKMSEKVQESAFSIFESLYYSILKDRQGLFDLMCNVVINCNGYFRLHNDYVQIIVSSRMNDELNELCKIRNKIIEIFNKKRWDIISEQESNSEIKILSSEAKTKIVLLAKNIFSKYSEDTRFSAIRIFNVQFKGVHIEAEIPQNKVN
jgi:hypothetical protein